MMRIFVSVGLYLLVLIAYDAFLELNNIPYASGSAWFLWLAWVVGFSTSFWKKKEK
jgi:hypothetical protein